MITTSSSRAFNQDTDRGKLAHVLLSNEEYQRLASPRRNIVEPLSRQDFPKSKWSPALKRTGAGSRFELMFLPDTNVIPEL